MILNERRRRMRSNGVHAESECDLLQQLASEVKKEEVSLPMGGFIVNDDFCFEVTNIVYPEPPQKKHWVLIMSDDLKLSPRRVQLILETNNFETMTQSTNEDCVTMSTLPLPIDCIVHNLTEVDAIHNYNILILNTLTPHQIFKECYQSIIEAVVCVDVKDLTFVSCLNTKIFHLREDAETPEREKRSMALSQILKSLQ